MNIAICDDSPDFLEQAVQMIGARREPGLQVTCFDNGDDLIAAHGETPFDVIFLDAVMPMLSGIETAAELRRRKSAVPIVFLTSSPEFAVESYRVKAYNYLLKPVTAETLFSCLDELRTSLAQQEQTICVRGSAAVYQLRPQQIELLEAQGKHVLVTLCDGSTVLARDPLYTYEPVLLRHGFFKCHRSYIVNMNCVRAYTHHQVTMACGANVPISRSAQKDFETAFFAAVFGKAGV